MCTHAHICVHIITQVFSRQCIHNALFLFWEKNPGLKVGEGHVYFFFFELMSFYVIGIVFIIYMDCFSFKDKV